jgi:hypothetical protein
MYIRNPNNGTTVFERKQDVGAGSTYNQGNPANYASMGLYPCTIGALQRSGPLPQRGGYVVHIADPRGRLRPLYGKRVGGPQPAPVVKVVEYVNPNRSARLSPSRIDDGVDYCGTGYFDAIAAGVVTRYTPNGWAPYGNAFEYRITQPGPLHGVHIYYNEGITPLKRVGDTFKAGEHLVRLIPGWSSCTECGFAAGDGTDRSWATVYGGGHHPGNCGTRAGVAYDNLVRHLGGGPRGILNCGPFGSWPPWMPGGKPPAQVLPGAIAGGVAGSLAGQLSVGAAVGDSTWPIRDEQAWMAMHNGVGEAAHHSHSAMEFATGKRFLTLPKGR